MHERAGHAAPAIRRDGVDRGRARLAALATCATIGWYAGLDHFGTWALMVLVAGTVLLTAELTSDPRHATR